MCVCVCVVGMERNERKVSGGKRGVRNEWRKKS